MTGAESRIMIQVRMDEIGLRRDLQYVGVENPGTALVEM